MITFKQKIYSEEDRAEVISFLGKIEGWKTLTRNFHWSALGKDIHEYLENLEKDLNHYQDEVAEVYQGLTSQRIGVGELKAEPIECEGPLGFIEQIISETVEFYSKIPDTLEYSGFKGIIEEMIAKEQKYNYLFSLCQ